MGGLSASTQAIYKVVMEPPPYPGETLPVWREPLPYPGETMTVSRELPPYPGETMTVSREPQTHPGETMTVWRELLPPPGETPRPPEVPRILTGSVEEDPLEKFCRENKGLIIREWNDADAESSCESRPDEVTQYYYSDVPG
jgi:hypothetical protein